MTRTARNTLQHAADLLTKHVNDKTPLGVELADKASTSRKFIVDAFNELLQHQAEGGTLVCATEIDGTLLGFVPRVSLGTTTTAT